MTLEIALVLGILAVALVLFVTECIRMDLVALLVLSSLAVLGLVSPADAVGGFANPAVVTVWAMFIISEGLTRAGISNQIGVQVARVAGRSVLRMISIFMLVGGAISAFMNNIGVAALLPVAITVSKRLDLTPRQMLMPRREIVFDARPAVRAIAKAQTDALGGSRPSNRRREYAACNQACGSATFSRLAARVKAILSGALAPPVMMKLIACSMVQSVCTTSSRGTISM